MKTLQTPLELKNEIEFSANMAGNQRNRQLMNILKEVNDEIIIEGVFKTIEDKSNLYDVQNCAAQILKELNPRTTKNAEGYIRRIFNNWNKSCKEIPFWMLEQYGFENLNNVLLKLENEGFSELEKDKLTTFKWWIKVSSTDTKSPLKQK